MTNAKFSQQKFWHSYENRLIKTIQTIARNLWVSVKLASLNVDFKACPGFIRTFPREYDLTLTYRLWGIV